MSRQLKKKMFTKLQSFLNNAVQNLRKLEDWREIFLQVVVLDARDTGTGPS